MPYFLRIKKSPKIQVTAKLTPAINEMDAKGQCISLKRIPMPIRIVARAKVNFCMDWIPFLFSEGFSLSKYSKPSRYSQAKPEMMAIICKGNL